MSVECPDCAFTFDVDHTDNDSHLYTCPVCGNPDPDPELERLLDEAHAGFGIR